MNHLKFTFLVLLGAFAISALVELVVGDLRSIHQKYNPEKKGEHGLNAPQPYFYYLDTMDYKWNPRTFMYESRKIDTLERIIDSLRYIIKNTFPVELGNNLTLTFNRDSTITLSTCGGNGQGYHVIPPHKIEEPNFKIDL